MTKPNPRRLHPTRSKSDNQSPVIVCWPDGARYILDSSTYHERGKLGRATQMYDPNGRRIYENER